MMELAVKPKHVPDDLVRDFDMYNPDGWQDDVHLSWKRMQDENPSIFWTPRNGGHWLVTRGELMEEIETDTQRFTSEESFVPRNIIPPLLPVNLDPPEHGPFRRLVMPAFMPKQLKVIEKHAKDIAVALIEEIAPRGKCEFVEDFAAAMPIQAFLTMMHLPLEDHKQLRRAGIDQARPNDPDAYNTSRAFLTEYIEYWIKQKRTVPDEGLLSQIVHGKVNDRSLNEDEILNLSVLILSGGLDTVVSMMSFSANFLAQNPEHRKQLIDKPKLHMNAVEELARRFGTTNMARKVREDVEFHDVLFAASDMVLLPRPLSGLDETRNEDPLVVDFARKRIQHGAFGKGPHTCPGAVLARRELMIFISEWLVRIPNFRIKPGTRLEANTGLVNSAVTLHLEWDL